MKKIIFNIIFIISFSIIIIGCSNDEDSPTIPGNGDDDAQWEIETILPAGSTGIYPSIAVGDSANPHVSYLGDDGYVKYAYKSGTTWIIEDIEYVANVSGTIANGGLSSIALDSLNNPHICYYDYGNATFKYAQKIGKSWNITTIILPNDPFGSSQFFPWAESSIAVDKATGIAHISLQMGGNMSGYALGYWRSDFVEAVIVDGIEFGNIGYHNSIALDINGSPGISYEERATGNLKYAHWNGASFDLEIVAPMPNTYWEEHLTSLAFDASNNPHIGYYGKDGDLGRYMYAYKDGSSWSIEATPYYSGYPSVSLDLDSSGKPHIALVVIDTGNSYRLKHALWDGSAWVFDTIEDDIIDCAIATGSSDKTHIIYGDEANAIKYALK